MNGNNKRYLASLLGLFTILAIGAFIFITLYYQGDGEDGKPSIKPPPKPQIIQEEIKTKKVVAYVPKSYPKDNDIEITSQPIKVAINGKEHVIQNEEVKEEHKLENGKLVVEEERTIEIKLPEQKTQLKKGVYVEYEKETHNPIIGARISYQKKNYDVDLKIQLYNKRNDNEMTITYTKWI